MEKGIEISIKRYNELLRKEFVYDIKRKELEKTDAYVSSDDRLLYDIWEEHGKVESTEEDDF